MVWLSKKSKQWEALGYETHNLIKKIGTSFDNEHVRKKIYTWKKRYGKKLSQGFKRVNTQTGVGTGILPPDLDPENPVDKDLTAIAIRRGVAGNLWVHHIEISLIF